MIKSQEQRGDDKRNPNLCAAVVGIGASAGALQAFEEFFRHLPSDCNLPFVLVQHLDPHQPSSLPDLLTRCTALPVLPARDGLQVKPRHVYVIPPAHLLEIKDGTLQLRPTGDLPHTQSAIDVFFRSLAEDQADRAVAVVLTGTGIDGTAGIRAIKANGGLVIAQSPDSAPYGSMPQSALDTGLVDYVLAVDQIPARLLEWSKRLEGFADTGKSVELITHQLERICGALLKATGHDFGRYKQGTLIRRIQRRMRVRQTASAADYARLLEDESQEAQALYKDLLIGVTQFFRDPDSFDALMRQVIPRILAGKPLGAPLRVWVPGCASGEEPYSIAMLLREYMQVSKRVHPVQIFATDIDEEALARARKGIYPERIAEDLTPSRLQQFFVQQEKGYEACLELREMCLFSHHNLVRDPPFSSLDLISCRNLLIYLETDLQQKLVPLFHYALQPGGYLFLGPSEGLASHPELFRTLDKKHRLLQRNDAVVAPMIDFPLSGRRWQPTLTQSLAIRGRSGREIQLNTGRVFERLVLEQFAPASVLINEQGEVLYFAGPTHRYLHHRLGAANVNLFEMTQGALGLEVRAAVRKVVKTRRPLVHENIPLERKGEVHQVKLLVRPMVEFGPDSGLMAVIIQEHGHAALRPVSEEDGTGPSGQAVIQQLEDDLRTAREDLQAAVEELESSNEELKSSNEELITSNEELQSANEELQTSKEELQSVNEELATVNAELNKKVAELDAAHNDLQNLFASTEIATIFLDRKLQIKKFTPAATALFHLRESDVDRPIVELAPRFVGTDLLSDIGDVLKSLTSREKEITVYDGNRCFLMRVLPYRTSEDVIAGVVVTFVDITTRRRAEEALEKSREETRRQLEEIETIYHSAPIGLCVFDRDLRYLRINERLAEINGLPASEHLGKTVRRIVPDLADQAERIAARIIETGQPVMDMEFSGTTSAQPGVMRTWVEHWLPLKDPEGKVIGIQVAAEEVTERKRAEERLRAQTELLTGIVDNIPVLLCIWDPALQSFRFNKHFREVMGWTEADAGPDFMAEVYPDPEYRRQVIDYMRSLETGWRDLKTTAKDGSAIDISWANISLSDGTSVGIGVDIRPRKTAEEELRQREEELRGILNATQESIWVFSPECVVLNANRKGLERMGKRSQEIIGKRMAEVLPPELGRAREQRVREVVESGRMEQFEDERAGIQFHHSFYPVMDQAGRVKSVVSFSRDITEQKALQESLRKSHDQLETKVHERTAELERKNKELQEFAFVASHDLNEPLRKIQTFGSLLASKGADRWSEENRDYISRITGSAGRMQELLAALLNYSRIEARGESFKPTPLNDVVRDAISDLEVEIKAAGAQLSMGSLPTIMGDPNQLRQLFQNLIGNAIKYRSPEVAPVIQFQCEEGDGQCRIFVEDNGIGFDEKYLDKIFQPFQRLHEKHEYSGTGIGLAICRKVVERHGGTIMAKSTPGKGSTFIVTLPVNRYSERNPAAFGGVGERAKTGKKSS